MRIVFMGTAPFAVPSLETVLRLSSDVIVYTQPDRPAGRGGKLRPSPVKEFAVRHNLPVYQPVSLRPPEQVEGLKALRPDLIVVAAYGLILPRAVLEIPPGSCLNVHASLLPKYRGPSPVAAAILNGDTVTGVTIMLVVPAVDAGPILAQAELPIEPADTTGTLTEKLAHQGAELLGDVIPRWCEGELTPRPQDPDQATFTQLIRKEDGRIDWTEPADLIWRKVRAYQPWPSAYTHWNDRLLKVIAAWPIGDNRSSDAAIGTVREVESHQPAVVTGRGLLRLDRVQLEGRKTVTGAEFRRGYPEFIGSKLR